MFQSTSRGPARALGVVAALAVSLLVPLSSVMAQDGSVAPGSVAPGSAAPEGAAPPGVSPYHGAEPGSGAGLKIGYISLGESVPFVKNVSDSIAAEAAVAGAEYVPCDSELDAAKALACAQNLKVQEVDGLINFQITESAAAQICAEGPQVPVLSVDIHQKPCEKAFMGADNTRAGNVLGEAVGRYIKDNFDCQYDALVLMTALAAGEVIKLRSDGTIEGFTNICGEPKNFTTVDVPSIQADEARAKFTDYLTTQPGAHRIVVMSLNDDMALGAKAAAENAGRGGDLWIGAHGGDHSGWKDVHCNPQWIADVAYFPEGYGKIAVPAIIDLIKGNEVAFDQLVNHVALNKDNITQYYPDAPAC